MTATLERLLFRLSKVVALLGGLVLLALILMTVTSIIGRAIGRHEALREVVWLAWWRAIRGDFELIEMGTAVAIFAFLPYCQMVRGNVVVDFFTNRSHPRLKAAMAVMANTLFSVIAALFAWRMALATHDLYSATFQQTSMLLRIPLWWGYLAATGFMLLLAVVCVYTVWRSLLEALGEGEPGYEPA